MFKSGKKSISNKDPNLDQIFKTGSTDPDSVKMRPEEHVWLKNMFGDTLKSF